MTDPQPSIPAEEYHQRWEAVQQLMERLQLDLLIAYADDRAVFGPAHARWLANFPVHFEPVCVLFPLCGRPVMLCGPESEEYIRLASQIADVRVLREFTHPDEDYPYSTIQGLAEVAAETLRSTVVRRAGLAGKSLISADMYSALRQALPGAEWLDVENDLCILRAQKSPAELKVIRYAYQIAEQGIQAGIAAIRVGVTEREAAAEMEAAMRRAGAEGTGIDTIVASGPNSRPILARSTFRKLQPDEPVLLTVAPRYEGYHAAIGRLVLLGDPGAEVRRALDAAIHAQQACGNAIRAGVEGRAVEAVGRKIIDEEGLGRYFPYSGLHSVGVIEFEPPIFGPSSPAKLMKDMVVSVDIPLFNAPWGGFRIEDGYQVTKEGAILLDHVPYVIQK